LTQDPEKAHIRALTQAGAKAASGDGIMTKHLRATGAAAGFAVACLAISLPALAQVSAPAQRTVQRSGASSDDLGRLQSVYDSQRDYTSRMEFLSDSARQGETWLAAQKFAECAVGFSEDRVRNLLDQAVEGKAKGKKIDVGEFLNRNQGCVATYMGFDRDFMRGAMAEAILTAEEGAPTIPGPGSADAVREFIKAVKAPSAKTDDPFVVGQLAAECRTGFAPMQVRALLDSEPGSAAEKGALNVLKAVTPQCASFAVADKPLTSQFERAFAAQALYHWVDLGPKLAKN
jgi:hypothetical protein